MQTAKNLHQPTEAPLASTFCLKLRYPTTSLVESSSRHQDGRPACFYSMPGIAAFLSLGYLGPNVRLYHRCVLIALGIIDESSNTTNAHGGARRADGILSSALRIHDGRPRLSVELRGRWTNNVGAAAMDQHVHSNLLTLSPSYANRGGGTHHSHT